ncbi:MAG TPA: hypothetical protein VNC61_14985 [Acidimicrobiales bacterium]|nr:hypothetical protein [Acidimicrobiales bacterium]
MLSGEEADLAQEFRRAVADDDGFGGLAAVLDDVDGAVDEDDEVVGPVAGGEEDFTGCDVELASVAAEVLELGRIEDG